MEFAVVYLRSVTLRLSLAVTLDKKGPHRFLAFYTIRVKSKGKMLTEVQER
jgi:hypothetical protein